MENNVQQSSHEDNFGDQTVFDVGAIVVTQTHPYLSIEGLPKIGSYNHFTPPFMIIIEAHHSGKHNTETGEKLSRSFKCLYYSTETGKFEDNWFKKEELKFVKEAPESMAKSCKDKSLSQLKRKADGENKGLIGSQAILTTVDLELNKKIIYKDSNPESIIYREKAMLDFLPPLCTILGISKIQTNAQYSEKTGRKLIDKGKFVAKIRWYNNKTSKFSEHDIPLLALKKVNLLSETRFKKDKVYLYKKKVDIEDNKIKLKAIPAVFHDMIFNHYKYEFRFKNLFTNELFLVDERNSIEIPNTTKEQALKNFLKDPIEKRVSEFKKGNWYKIKYIDRRRNYTERIIWTRDVKKDSEFLGQEEVRLIEANCLLRNGAIRHFLIGRIFKSKEITKDFIRHFINDR